PPASCIPRPGGQLHRREDGGAALLLWHELAAAGYRRGDSDASPAGSFADGSCPRRGRATAQGGGRSQAANGAHDDLFGWFAHLRGYAAHGTGYRQRAHGDLRAARQRAQGSLYGPVRPAARHSSRLLASDTAIALAVSWPQSGPADNQAGVATGLPARGRGRRAGQVGHGPHVATQFCDQHSPSWGQRSQVPKLPWRAHVGPTRSVNLPDVRFTSNSYRALALQ